MKRKTIVSLIVLALVAVACATDTAAEEEVVEEAVAMTTLEMVRDRGFLKCGVSGSATAFSETQADGSVTGIDADYCYAVAAAIFGDYSKVEFKSLTSAERFTSLAAGDVDVLIRNTTWTQSRDTELGNDFGPTTYYDGQQLMGRNSDGLSASSTLKDIDGLRVCTNAGTTTEKNITEGAGLVGATIELVTVEKFGEAVDKFIAGECDIVTTDGSGLVGRRAVNDALNCALTIAVCCLLVKLAKLNLAYILASCTAIAVVDSIAAFNIACPAKLEAPSPLCIIASFAALIAGAAKAGI